MFIEQPPTLYRRLFPAEALWRLPGGDRPVVYLTFDDGPIPEVTPWVLDLLDSEGIKATFFLVGDNAARNPGLVDDILRRGHSIGNHTMHHTQGLRVSSRRYFRDILAAHALIGSPLFRPPHGLMAPGQASAILRRFRIVMYDLVTRDYDRSLGPDRIVDNVSRYARDGSIIVFHDSLKAWPNLREALPRAIALLRARGFSFLPLPMQ